MDDSLAITLPPLPGWIGQAAVGSGDDWAFRAGAALAARRVVEQLADRNREEAGDFLDHIHTRVFGGALVVGDLVAGHPEGRGEFGLGETFGEAERGQTLAELWGGFGGKTAAGHGAKIPPLCGLGLHYV